MNGLLVLVGVGVSPFVSTAEAFEHRHAVGMGYQVGSIATEEAGSFHFGSFPISYLGRYGGTWAAELRTSILLPFRARQEDVAFSPQAEYDRTQLYDGLLSPNVRFTKVVGWEIDSGIGAHAHFVRFQSAKYVEWSSAALGVGAGATLRRAISEEYWGGHGEVAVRGDLSYDFIDLSRGGAMRGGVQGQLLLCVGFAMGAKE